MHEFHATEAILKHALGQAAQRNASKIVAVQFVVGEISTYTPESITGAWEVLARGTAAEGARLDFRSIPAEAQCMVCFNRYHPEAGAIICPHCGSVGAKIIAGEEFYMESADVE